MRDKWALEGMEPVADVTCLYPPNHPNKSFKRSMQQRRVTLIVSCYFSSFWATSIIMYHSHYKGMGGKGNKAELFARK